MPISSITAGATQAVASLCCPDVPQLRHLACQVGYPNGEQEYRGHQREPEQETINAVWIVPKVLSLPRTRPPTPCDGTKYGSDSKDSAMEISPIAFCPAPKVGGKP